MARKKIIMTEEQETKYLNNNKLFPVYYNFEMWPEKDCDDVFLAFYSDKLQLNGEGGVYAAEKLYVYPCGKMEEW